MQLESWLYHHLEESSKSFNDLEIQCRAIKCATEPNLIQAWILLRMFSKCSFGNQKILSSNSNYSLKFRYKTIFIPKLKNTRLNTTHSSILTTIDSFHVFSERRFKILRIISTWHFNQTDKLHDRWSDHRNGYNKS